MVAALSESAAAAAEEDASLFPPLRTERLLLRPLRPTDAADLHRLVNDWEVARMLARVPFPYPRELADDWIGSTRSQIAAGKAWHLAIVEEASQLSLIHI